MNIENFWRAVLAKSENEIKSYFAEGAYVNWHCTNEHFNVSEFIRANCEYPGEWDGEIERKHVLGCLIITVTHVFQKTGCLSFHVTSFIETKDDRIISIDEYWGDDSPAPKWRMDKNLGTAIK